MSGPINPPRSRDLIRALASGTGAGAALSVDAAMTPVMATTPGKEQTDLKNIADEQIVLLAASSLLQGLKALDGIVLPTWDDTNGLPAFIIQLSNSGVPLRFPAFSPADLQTDVATLVAKIPMRPGAMPNALSVLNESDEPSWPFIRAMGLRDPDAFRFTCLVMDTALAVALVLAHQTKMALQVPRPSTRPGGPSTMIPVPNHSSMPSGHAMQAHTLVPLLKELTGRMLDPTADGIAENRELAGLHTARDSAVGKTLGLTLGGVLVQMAVSSGTQFKRWADLVALAKAEWAP